MLKVLLKSSNSLVMSLYHHIKDRSDEAEQDRNSVLISILPFLGLIQMHEKVPHVNF